LRHPAIAARRTTHRASRAELRRPAPALSSGAAFPNRALIDRVTPPIGCLLAVPASEPIGSARHRRGWNYGCELGGISAGVRIAGGGTLPGCPASAWAAPAKFADTPTALISRRYNAPWKKPAYPLTS